MDYKGFRTKVKEKKANSLPLLSPGQKVKLIPFKVWWKSHSSDDLYSAFNEYYAYYITAFEEGKLFKNPSEFKVLNFLIRQAEMAFCDQGMQEIDQTHVVPMNLMLSKAAIKSIEQRPLVVDYQAVADSILSEEEEDLIEDARKVAYTER